MAAPMMFNQSPWYKTACWTCRDRKVKCDKVLPCRNCTVAGIMCSYPPQVRTVRRPKKAQARSNSKQNDVLKERIDKLEALLKKQSPEIHLGDDSDNHNDNATFNITRPGDQEEDTVDDRTSALPTSSRLQQPTNLMSLLERIVSGQSDDIPYHEPRDTMEKSWKLSPTSASGTFAPQQTLIDCDASDAGYWKKIEQECASQVFIKPPANAKASSPIQDRARREPVEETPIMSFPFQGASTITNVPLLSLAQRQTCWKKYVENVDPILKILHKKTMQTLILTRDEHAYTINASSKALIQALCLMAVTSMSDADVVANFDTDKHSVTQHCASLTEQALMAAKFLEAQDLSIIQALLLFLYYLRCVEDPRFSALSGMVTFLAVRLGLNRDSAASGLSCLEAELRRRTWWQLVNLVDHPDDSGLDYFPFGIGADTRMPLNVDDDELDAQHTGPQEERTGFTEASFCLMQYEVTRTFHLIKFERARASSGCKFRAEEAEQQLYSSREVIRNKYFQGDGKEAAVAEYAANVIAMVLAKRRILMHISPDRNRTGEVLLPDAQDHLFLLAVHVLELSRGLQTNASAGRWRWLSATYFQWSIAAFVVRNLTIRPSSPATNRAWRAVDGLLDQWPASVRNCAKANALRGLLADAARAREAQNQNIWTSTISAWPSSNFSSFPPAPLSHHKAATRDRWMDLQREWTDCRSPLQSSVVGPALKPSMGFEGFGDFVPDFDELACDIDFGELLS
ncbi:hypothetical protein H2204_006171 [Knufia peltigerae]|uniref:Zn(2)-C6 fungal-type domain-containing protein n=1 Tax=Knufia peltigerae TaxID=1002370 RepID=A0AA38Y445_9EURO|nr:hypothetical protein H2204_006171 [Knufia peltigerae]